MVVGRQQRFERRLRDGLVWQSDVCASLEEALAQADERADEAAA